MAWVGRLVPVKDPHRGRRLLRATRSAEARLHVFGTGRRRPSWRAAAAGLLVRFHARGRRCRRCCGPSTSC
ncbi:MAG: hypothetical protein R3F30_05515 [Planctomycetota bacterium]